MKPVFKVWPVLAYALVACSEESSEPRAPSLPTEGIVYRADVQPVARVDDALKGVFIPPFRDCRAPLSGATGGSADGQVCTQVAISGATEPGKYFPDYGSCEVVRTQRPYWPAPPAKEPPTADARLSDAAYLAELAWANEQIAATGCTCCHDGRLPGGASQWDIARGPLWLDTLSDTGLALFAGLADSSVLGAYPAADNHGFDRDITGIPSTDSARMKKLMLGELSRRGLSEAWARAVPPFGGPIYANSIKQPAACQAGEGVDAEGAVRWTGGTARYVYVLAQGSKNPGVPPNLDLPTGTLFRLDVLANAQPVASGIRFGETPPGTFQAFPERTPAQPLVRGTTYQLVVLRDVGLPLANCLFEFGAAIAQPAQPDAALTPETRADASADYPRADAGAGSDASSAMCTLAGGDARGFGAPCQDTANHSDCPCEANYCSKSPFDAQGTCSVQGCKENPTLCPAGFRCLDISMFAPGQPSVCVKS